MSTTCTSIALAMAYFCVNPVENLATDSVDLVEINHFYDEAGKHVFDQVIFYDWSPRHNRYHVRAWRLLKHPTQIPRRDWARDCYIAVWYDGIVMRRVVAQAVRESWTQYDPELVERSFLPKEQRRELSKLIAKSTLDP